MWPERNQNSASNDSLIKYFRLILSEDTCCKKKYKFSKVDPKNNFNMNLLTLETSAIIVE